MRALIKKIFDIPFCYRFLRTIGTGGVQIKPIISELDLQNTDRILDVGCGSGDYAAFIPPNAYYLGVDSDPHFIQKALDKYKQKNVEFICSDFLEVFLPPKSFDKVLVIFTMHHIDDDNCKQILKKLSVVVKERCIIVENMYMRYHFVNNILCALDRGSFIRSFYNLKELITTYFNIEKVTYYYTRTFVKKRVLFVCKPKHIS
jgi:ubiquinone/menaquinone biosynthesis C-methylase UbiE